MQIPGLVWLSPWSSQGLAVANRGQRRAIADIPQNPHHWQAFSPKSGVKQGCVLSLSWVPNALPLLKEGHTKILEGGPRLARPSFKWTLACPGMGAGLEGVAACSHGPSQQRQMVWEPDRH